MSISSLSLLKGLRVMEIRRFLRLKEQIFATNACDEAVPNKDEPILSFLNFADLPRYEKEMVGDGLTNVDHIQDVGQSDCLRYGKNFHRTRFKVVKF